MPCCFSFNCFPNSSRYSSKALCFYCISSDQSCWFGCISSAGGASATFCHVCVASVDEMSVVTSRTCLLFFFFGTIHFQSPNIPRQDLGIFQNHVCFLAISMIVLLTLFIMTEKRLKCKLQISKHLVSHGSVKCQHGKNWN